MTSVFWVAAIRRRGDQNRRQVFASWPDSAWRSGIGPDEAVDVFAVLCSIGTYDIATVERGWSPERLEQWWYETLRALLLADPPSMISAGIRRWRRLHGVWSRRRRPPQPAARVP